MVCLTLGENVFGYTLLLLLLAFSWYRLLIGDFKPSILLMVLGSYHSAFDNVYTSSILGIKMIYLNLLLLIFFGAIRIRIPRKYRTLVFVFVIFYILHFSFGFLFKYSIEWFLNESFSFFVFFSIILIVLGSRDYFVPLIFEVLSKYVLYFYPFLVLVAVLTAKEEVLLFDEFEKFYFLALVPLLLRKIPHRSFLIVLNIVVVIVKAKYTYFSSLNIILMTTIVALIFLMSNLSLLRKTIFVVALLSSAGVFYNFSNDVTKFKIRQSQIAIQEVLSGNVNAIPKSPRVRVIEFMLSFKNLEDQGWPFMFTGKGYGSFIDDNKHQYFKEYKVQLLENDFSLEEIEKLKFKKAHGGVPYIPIKMGIMGMLLFAYFGYSAFMLSFKKGLLWFGLSAPFYIITTFSYGLKNFIFVAFATGVALSFKGLNTHETENLLN